MKPFNVGDIRWDKNTVDQLRQEVIEIRDRLLTDSNFESAIILSYTIACLSALAEEIEGDEHVTQEA